jgi:hypothetical protein
VDRARASAHASMRRLLNDLCALQSDRWLRAEVLREGFDEAWFGIADTHRVIKGLADNERLKSLFLTSPIGVDPLAQTIQTQSANPVGQASRPVGPPSAPTIRTQSAAAPDPSRDRQGAVQPPVAAPIPRNAPCPCHSGLKYKRCCGTAAPPVLTDSPRPRAPEPAPIGLNRITV